MTDLPTFRYFPDPVGVGSIRQSSDMCVVCGQLRGWVYAGPIFSEEDVESAICAWCIADGSAHDRLHVSFTDIDAIGGYNDTWERVPRKVAEEIAWRTPGFTGWQHTHWWTHCRDGAEFLGYAGHEELTGAWQDAVDVVREVGTPQAFDDDEWADVLGILDPHGSATAYVFRCRHCGKLGGYWDCD